VLEEKEEELKKKHAGKELEKRGFYIERDLYIFKQQLDAQMRFELAERGLIDKPKEDSPTQENPNKKEEAKKSEAQKELEAKKAEKEGKKEQTPEEQKAQKQEKTSQLMQSFNEELKSNNINLDKFTKKNEEEIKNLDNSEINELSKLILKGILFAKDKSDTNNNPGWLLLYLSNTYPTLVQLLPPETLHQMAGIIMDGYLTKRQGIHYTDLPLTHQDLKDNEKYKDIPLSKKIYLEEGLIAREMWDGHLRKDDSDYNIMLHIIDQIPWTENSLDKPIEEKTPLEISVPNKPTTPKKLSKIPNEALHEEFNIIMQPNYKKPQNIGEKTITQENTIEKNTEKTTTNVVRQQQNNV
jgi:hypothetical protein